MESLQDLQKRVYLSLGGWNGSAPVYGTDQFNINCMAFCASEDTVISSLGNDTHDLLAAIDYDSRTIFAGETIFFGVVATKIKLTSGSGHVLRSEPPVFADAPLLVGNRATNAGGTTIELNFTELMVDPAAFPEEFVVKVADEAVTLTSVAFGTPNSQYIITLDAAVVNGDVITITMQSTKIKSAAGAYFAGCTDLSIQNIVPET
jgi:hypothetical protein